MYNRNFYKTAAYRRQMEKRAYLTNLGVELIKVANEDYPSDEGFWHKYDQEGHPDISKVLAPAPVVAEQIAQAVGSPAAAPAAAVAKDPTMLAKLLGLYTSAKDKAGAGYKAVKDFGTGHYSDFMKNPFGEGKKLKDAGRLAAVLGAAGLLGYGGYKGIKALMGPGGPSEEELAMQAAAAQAADQAARRKKLMRNLGIGAGIATAGGLGYMATRKRSHDRD